MKVRNRPSQDYMPASQSSAATQRGSHEDRQSLHPLRELELQGGRDSDCGNRKNTWPPCSSPKTDSRVTQSLAPTPAGAAHVHSGSMSLCASETRA